MTLKDLSRELGVSPSTISRVLNGCRKNFSIPDELRRRILDYVKESGYQVNPVFQSMKKQVNKQIAILFYSRSSMGTGYTVELMVDRAIRFFEANEYDIHFTFNRSRQPRMKYSLPPWKCAGLLIPDCSDPQQLSIVEASGTPYVCMNGIAGPHGTSVIIDETESMRSILQYFSSLGHRKIAYVTAEKHAPPSPYDIGSLRLNSFRDNMLKMKLDPLIVHVKTVFGSNEFVGANFKRFDGTPDYCYEMSDFTPCLLQSGVTGIVCESRFVMELLYWAGKAGIRIPGNLSIVAYDDLPFLRRTTPPVTSYRVPAEEMGATASKILYEKLHTSPDYRQGETISLTGNLIYRESTAPRR